MARAPTTFSRVSTGYKDSVNTIAESTPDFSCIDGQASTMSMIGAFSGAAVTGTTGTFSTSLAVGGGTAVTKISTLTGAVDLGSIAGHDSTSSTVAFSGVTVGDQVFVTPDSAWSGAYYDIRLEAHATAADVVTLVVANSAATAIDPDAVTMRFTAISYAAFV